MSSPYLDRHNHASTFISGFMSKGRIKAEIPYLLAILQRRCVHFHPYKHEQAQRVIDELLGYAVSIGEAETVGCVRIHITIENSPFYVKIHDLPMEMARTIRMSSIKCEELKAHLRLHGYRGRLIPECSPLELVHRKSLLLRTINSFYSSKEVQLSHSDGMEEFKYQFGVDLLPPSVKTKTLGVFCVTNWDDTKLYRSETTHQRFKTIEDICWEPQTRKRYKSEVSLFPDKFLFQYFDISPPSLDIAKYHFNLEESFDDSIPF